MSSVEERIARNNRTFRAANEKIRARVDDINPQVERIPFLCECPTEGCTEIVQLTVDQYADIRADESHFLTKNGHEDAERPLGLVVSRTADYVIVEKDVG